MKKLLLIFLLIAAWSVQAREVYPLCDDWLFSFRYENSSDNARCVTLPHTWNLDALAGTIPYLRTTADYQRKLYVPQTDRKSTRLNSSHTQKSRMPSSA